MASTTTNKDIFTISGQRETITKQRAIDLVQPLYDAINNNQNDKYYKIVLSNKSFTVDAAEIFADAISKLDNITHVDYSDIIAGQSTDDAVNVLNIITSPLRKFKLIEFNISDNALGQKGIIAIANALHSQHTLQHVYFNNNGLQSDAVLEIKTLLDTHINNNNGKLVNLQTLEIFNNLLTDAGAIELSNILKDALQLQQLRIQTNRISNKGGQAILHSLKHHKHLNRLTLADNSFGDVAGQIALDLVVQNKTLTVINYSDIGFDKSYILGILVQLSNKNIAPNLQELHLSHSELTANNVKYIIDVLRCKPKLHTLYLEGNDLHSNGAIELLNEIKQHNNITHINLSENYIHSKSVDTIIDLIQSHNNLQLLSLKGNYLADETVEQIQDVITNANKNIIVELDEQEEEEDEEEEEEDDNDEEDIATPSDDVVQYAGDIDNDVDQLADQIKKTNI